MSICYCKAHFLFPDRNVKRAHLARDLRKNLPLHSYCIDKPFFVTDSLAEEANRFRDPSRPSFASSVLCIMVLPLLPIK